MKGFTIARSVLFFTALVFVATSLVCVNNKVEAFSGGGLGENYSPFVITDCVEFQEIEEDPEQFYILGGDIDCSGSGAWNDGDGFIPIDHFEGVLDGRNYTVDGLTMDRSDNDNNGVFGENLSGTVRNINFTNLDVSAPDPGAEYTGGFVGTTDGATISDVHVNGTVTARTIMGGFAGSLENGTTVVRSSFTGDSTDTQSYGGGFAGFVIDSDITDSFADGNYLGQNVGGGFAARLIANDGKTTTVDNSYFNGNVVNDNYRASFISFLDEYDTGEVLVRDSFVVADGSPDGGDPAITRPFASTTGTPTVTNFYFDENAAMDSGCGAGFTCTGINDDGESNDYYINTSIPAPLDGWDFENVWETEVAQFPQLQVGDLATLDVVAFAGGEGTEGDPYQITDCLQLQAIRQEPDAHFVITSNVDCSDTVNWNEGQGFHPLGDDHSFTGSLDGGNFEISDLFINRPETSGVGLFYEIDSSEVVDVNLVDVDITGENSVGGLAGISYYGNVIGSSTSGTVTGLEGVGGLIGTLEGDYESGIVLEDSSSSASVSGELLVGGLVGYSNEVNLSGVSATGDVEGGGYVGGLIGGNHPFSDGNFSIVDSYATGNVSDNYTGEDEFNDVGFGGLVGVVTYVTIEDSYATGNVETEANWAGGLLGAGIVSLENTYATGNVTGLTGIAGLAGYLVCMGAPVSGSFSSGSVNGQDAVGGFLGTVEENCDISESYTTSDVTSEGDGAGFAAIISDDTLIRDVYASGTLDADSASGLIYDNGEDEFSNITNSFWDAEVSGVSDSSGGTAKTTAQMLDIATYTTDLGEDSWDFDDVWSISVETNEGYPCLQWTDASCPPSTPAVDFDTDGISDEIEDASPNGGDANNDGIPDSQQDNVASFVNSMTSNPAVLEVDAECAISSVSTISEAEESDVSDSGYDYPAGLMHFTIECGTPGFTATVSQYYYGVAGNFSVRKYVPSSGAYTNLPGSTISTIEIAGQSVKMATYQLVDGSAYDIDGETNSVIEDPAGLAMSNVGSPNTGLR